LDSSPDLSPFLLDLDLDMGSKDSDLVLDLRTVDLDLHLDLTVAGLVTSLRKAEKSTTTGKIQTVLYNHITPTGKKSQREQEKFHTYCSPN